VLYLTDRSVGTVRRLRIDGWSELPSIPAGVSPHAVDVLPGGAVVVGSAGDDLLRIDGLAFDAGGRFLLVSDLLGGLVSLIDLSRGRVSAWLESGLSAGARLVLTR
jgi:hypothetical protein